MENFDMVLANLLAGIICVVLGLIIRTGKATFLIAGYNTMSAKEKKLWNAQAMSKFVGHMLIATGLVLIVPCVPIWFDFYAFAFLCVSWLLFTVILLGSVVYMNTSSRFKNK